MLSPVHLICREAPTSSYRGQEQVETEISLNLVTTYPVGWSRYKVLRELVQNFYDALGRERWSQAFGVRRDQGALVLEAEAVDFSYEWLLHIGASTKTGAASGKFAGFFGEGFKIASLCAHRDLGWRITMASRDWTLRVGTNIVEVDGVPLQSLCYRVKRRASSSVTSLRIARFSSADETALNAVLLSFYYPENPLIGECLWCDDSTAVHLRTEHPKPPGYPTTSEWHGPGIVFAGFQAMGSFQLPLVIAQHDARPKNRERDSFFRMDVIDLLKAVSRRLPAHAAAQVLEMLSPRWYELPRRRYDFDSCYPVVSILAARVASSPKERERWRERHPNLLVGRPVRRSDLPAWNRRRQARDWLRQQRPGYRLVQDGFAQLGYPDLEAACQEAGGFVALRQPTEVEERYLDLLGEAAQLLCSDLLPDRSIPPIRIIENASAAWQGMASLDPVPPRVSGGYRIRYRHDYIALDRRLLHPALFSDALATFFHELAHACGGERTMGFASALTDLIARTADEAETLQLIKERWQTLPMLRR